MSLIIDVFIGPMYEFYCVTCKKINNEMHIWSEKNMVTLFGVQIVYSVCKMRVEDVP